MQEWLLLATEEGEDNIKRIKGLAGTDIGQEFVESLGVIGNFLLQFHPGPVMMIIAYEISQ